jgi:peptide/nickel transport system permease protein
MVALIGKRLFFSVFILLAVSVIIFVATLLLPGDPAQAVLGQQATPERLEALRARMGLDQPVLAQYFSWLGGMFTGDFGYSAAADVPVGELLSDRIGASVVLMLLAALVSVPLGIALGTYQAIRRGKTSDHVVTNSSLVFAAMPDFVIGVLLVTLFATSVFQVLPSVTMTQPGEPVWANPAQLVLPVITLALVVTPYVARMMRATLVEVLDSGYVEMARLKGVPERLVILRHAVPHAIGPVAQVVAIQLAWLAGGVVVVEFLFRYPGIGQALVDAVTNRDVQVVQALTLLVAAVYIVVNLLADLVGILTNPKLRKVGA